MLFGIRTQGVASLALGYALVGLSVRFVCLYCALCERLGAIGGTGAPVGGLAAHLQFEHAAAHDVVVE